MGVNDGPCWCCCCISGGSRTGSIVIGVVEIVLSTILVLAFVVAASLAFAGKLLVLIKGEEDSSPTFYHNPWTDPFFVVLSIFALLFLFNLGFAIALVIGVKKASHCHIKNWMKFKIFLLTIFFVLCLEYVLIVRFSDVIFIGVAVGLFLMNLYFYLVVNSYCKSIQETYYKRTFGLLEEMKTLQSLDPISIT